MYANGFSSFPVALDLKERGKKYKDTVDGKEEGFVMSANLET